MSGNIFERAFLEGPRLHLRCGAFSAFGLALVQRVNTVGEELADIAVAIARLVEREVLAEPNPIQCAR